MKDNSGAAQKKSDRRRGKMAEEWETPFQPVP